MKAALAQIAPRLADPDANLALHARAIDDAVARGAELVVFPELSLTGYGLMEAATEVAEPLDGPHLRALRELSRRAALVVGFVEEAAGAQFYNSAVYMDRGEIVHVHRKVYLPTHGLFDESRYFAAGERIRTFDTRFGRAGMLVCRDFWHLGPAYVLAAGGLELLLVASASPGRGALGGEGRFQSTANVELLGQTFARSFGAHVLHTNRVGCEEGVTFTGASEAFGPGGERLARGRDLDEDLVLVDVDPEARRAQRIRIPFLSEERPHLILRELRRALADRDAAPF